MFFLDGGVPAGLESLLSSLGLVDRSAGLGLAAAACEECDPLACLGDTVVRTLFLPSSHEAPAVDDLRDSACKG